jgi:hypothetical protein
MNPCSGQKLFGASFENPYFRLNTQIMLSGSAQTVAGIPSIQLQLPTNTELGYFSGCMLARSAGDGTGAYAGQIAGALINWDPNSTDTGQKVWCKMVLYDSMVTAPILPKDGLYVGSYQAMVQKGNNILREQFLYGPSTPKKDKQIVSAYMKTLADAGDITRTTMQNSSSGSEIAIIY